MPTPQDPHSTGAEHAGTCLAFPALPPDPPLRRYAPGAVLSGKYRLESLLGEGGMGAVWRASNLLLDLPVAIKLIRSDLDRGALRGRLQLEARAAAKLGHPGIVRVYDVGESEQGDPFIVMELLHGETLGALLARTRRLSGTRAVQLLLPIIDALAMAHARGIVHRDLKPDNLLIALEEQRVQPKILDFGVAKLTDPRDSDHKLTAVGTVVGSPDYMSPEQARGLDDVDAATDIWATCVVLYEAVTGNAPFCAPNYHALLRAIVEDAPKPLTDYAAGDAGLWEILQRGLAKDRRERYRTISDLGRALAGWLLGQGVREDACGSSLDSTWFGRTSDPSHLSQLPESERPVVVDSQSTVSTAATGIARGPFSATVRPGASARARTWGIAVAACSLLALSALAFRNAKQPLAQTAVPAAAVAVPLSSAAAPASLLAPRPNADARKPAAANPSPPLPQAATPGRPAKPALAKLAPAKVQGVRLSELASKLNEPVSKPNEPVSRPAAPVSPPPPAKRDLLVPY